MWPLYLLLNKILKPEEEGGEVERDRLLGSLVGDDLDLVQPVVAYGNLSLDGKCRASVGPRAHFIDVPHINQLCSWDCGLACILMVFRNMGIDNCNIETLAELCSTKSIWTVDLAYLLKKFSVNFSYYTITVGANPNYSDETFYKEQLSTDVVRVEKLFREALVSGISILCRSISEEEISLSILSGKYIAIALVDQYKLSSRTWLKDIGLSSFGNGNEGYTGHYIVICGYDTDKDEFEIRDPASSRKHEKVSSKYLGEARKSFGTDEDLLLISLDNGKNGVCCSSLQISPLVKYQTMMPE
ncbi:hypothetical protein CDL15_Pgr022568 [Punica granatum]|uniref:Protein GUCD1 n=1 Tax=Punica granatum TaxID=22663 RepID=A0A218XR57_PUNGR|nr:hypothetical protein CDL15_Pgr022568 [Punica granatum]